MLITWCYKVIKNGWFRVVWIELMIFRASYLWALPWSLPPLAVSQSRIMDSADKVIYIDSRHILMCLLSRYRQLRPSQTFTCIIAFCISLHTNLNHPSIITYKSLLFLFIIKKIHYGFIFNLGSRCWLASLSIHSLSISFKSIYSL